MNRMHGASVRLVVGHRLRGLLPCVPRATLLALSIWANNLEGHLPDLQIQPRSDVILHSNHLSCQLPRNKLVRANFSTAMIGNRFAAPSRYPPWITEDEQSSLFCVSTTLGMDVLLKLLCGGTLLAVAIIVWGGQRVIRQTFRDQNLAEAWCRTTRGQAKFALASCMLMLQYGQVVAFTCMVVFHRLRFPTLAPRRRLSTSFE
eukprot:327087-Amphidinium_carterae.1